MLLRIKEFIQYLKAVRIFLISVIVGCIAPAVAHSQPNTPNLWLAPTSTLALEFHGPVKASDYLSPFTDGASTWPVSRSHISVFKIYQGVVRHLSDRDLALLFKSLKTAKIKLAIEYGMMSPASNCGNGLEGYYGKFAASTALKIKRLGGHLDYLAMDEPLWYGADFGGVRGCRRSIGAVAQDVAQHIEEVRQVFPDVQVGDIEPAPQLQSPNWPEQIAEWIDAFRLATGRPLAFFHSDVQWNTDWRSRLVSISRVAKLKNVAFGVIIDGTASDKSDDAWSNDALQNLEQVQQLKLAPSTYIFQSWNRFPDKVDHETDPGTMTNLILRYLKNDSH